MSEGIACLNMGHLEGLERAFGALAWLIGRKTVTSVVIAGRTEAQFKDNLIASELKLTAEEQ